jgi:uncharacterized protein
VLQDLQALLELQADDAVVTKLQARHDELHERMRELDGRHRSAEEALERARSAVAAEEKRWRELAGKFEEHKQLQAKHLAVLDAVKKAREATAAMAQIDSTRKVLVQEESDLHAVGDRLEQLRQTAQLLELELAEVEQTQQAARTEIEEARQAASDEIAHAQTKRAESASRVSRGLLTRYERIRSRDGSSALFPLRGSACGRCNTAVPLSRRNSIMAGRSIEVCEGCGVLLYAE